MVNNFHVKKFVFRNTDGRQAKIHKVKPVEETAAMSDNNHSN